MDARHTKNAAPPRSVSSIAPEAWPVGYKIPMIGAESTAIPIPIGSAITPEMRIADSATSAASPYFFRTTKAVIAGMMLIVSGTTNAAGRL